MVTRFRIISSSTMNNKRKILECLYRAISCVCCDVAASGNRRPTSDKALLYILTLSLTENLEKRSPFITGCFRKNRPALSRDIGKGVALQRAV